MLAAPPLPLQTMVPEMTLTSPRSPSAALFVLALTLFFPLGEAHARRAMPRAPECAPDTSVTAGTCLCPYGTSFRTQVSGNVCTSQGMCTCDQGTWNGAQCVTAPPPPCGGRCQQGQICVNEACVYTGPLRFTLTWDQPGDMDLHIVTPNGSDVNYRQPRGGGGTLDRDDRTGTGPENIYWPQNPPYGTYLVCVEAFQIVRPTNFTVQISFPNGQVQTFNGSRAQTMRAQCAQGSPNLLTSIALGQGAPIVQPPVVVQPAPTNPPVVVQPPMGGPRVFTIQMQNGATRQDGVITFVGWDGQVYSARVEGDVFVVALNGDFRRAERRASIEFADRGGQRATARIEGSRFVLSRDGGGGPDEDRGRGFGRGRGRDRDRDRGWGRDRERDTDVLELMQPDRSVIFVRIAG